ncbi:hypothetical protein KIPE111705_43025 [Kibdelosporangium persicum]|uniref:hypothetical protein n=1 Tax=Kibdelosporangium persicum TaxID=2698649 RepID=UPI001567716F|nr:hypothetical protein [Kibdelosporangium persicum]
MAKHAAGPGAPAFEITDADRNHPPKHSQEERRPDALRRVLIDVKNIRKAG